MRVSLTPEAGLSTTVAVESGDGRILVRQGSADPVPMDSHPLFGDDDPGHCVSPVHPAVETAMRRHSGLRLAATGNPYHELIPAVLAQRVTAAEAIGQWQRICRAWGERVTLTGIAGLPEAEMHAPPTPDRILGVPLHEWHLLGVDRRRAEAIRNVARHGSRLLAGWKPGEAAGDRTRSLTLIEGVGEWTAAVAGHAAFGDPDALEFGDFHVKNTVAWALEGRARGSDEEMRASMAPYAGQRRRVLAWLSLDGWKAPARGPRRRNLDIARL
jgi:3-methyladenine DNA glycosylase/8-oxoguanine DNA glycosylase